MPRGTPAKVWTDSETELLITLVEQRPCIWEKASADKKNNYKLSKDWDEISTALNLPKRTVQDKWKSLFRRMRAEVARCPPDLSGAAAGQYTSNWEFFDKLQFILGSILWGESSGNLTEHLKSIDELDSEMSGKKRPSTSEIVHIEGRKIAALESIGKSMDKENDDDDLLFVKTLLPFIRKIPEEKRLLFREDISKLVRKYLDEDDCIIVETSSSCTPRRKPLLKQEPNTATIKKEVKCKIKTEMPRIICIDDDEDIQGEKIEKPQSCLSKTPEKQSSGPAGTSVLTPAQPNLQPQLVPIQAQQNQHPFQQPFQQLNQPTMTNQGTFHHPIPQTSHHDYQQYQHNYQPIAPWTTQNLPNPGQSTFNNENTPVQPPSQTPNDQSRDYQNL